jgi:hypothetical protein
MPLNVMFTNFQGLPLKKYKFLKICNMFKSTMMEINCHFCQKGSKWNHMVCYRFYVFFFFLAKISLKRYDHFFFKEKVSCNKEKFFFSLSLSFVQNFAKKGLVWFFLVAKILIKKKGTATCLQDFFWK